ncbi:MAG: hypothetical protein HQ500_06315 [Flavobacteriales bacterium]|nr:hypothetical protein [Flavobacteriales bacterium]
MRFPLYRKYPNDLSFFKILDDSHFIEVKRTGKSADVHHFEAKILPDRNFIQDMLNMEGGFWVESSPEEFSLHLAAAQGN